MVTRISVLAVIILSVLSGGWLLATPSTTYWTTCISDVQDFGVWHIGYDNYTTVGRTAAKGRGSLPAVYGLTVGVLPFEKLEMEVGVDLTEPTDYPISFNAKIGTPENALFSGSPALNFGIFNVGTKSGVTDYNILHTIIGKTLPYELGRLHAGYYNGKSNILVSGTGKKEDDGVMVGFDRYIYKDKVMLAADYASGKNAIGGGGVGVYYFFTKDISLLVGPVWFNDRALNGKSKWTLQLDINF